MNSLTPFIILIHGISIVLSQQGSGGTCSYTFQVPAGQFNSQCNGGGGGDSETRRLLEQIRIENKQIQDENAVNRQQIQGIIEAYGTMVETVKTLQAETASWRQIVEWPVFDSAMTITEAAQIIDESNTYEECYQAVRRNSGKEGIYSIKPRDALHPFLVYCDKEAWTVILRRFDGKVDFFRNWNDFSGGFGEVAGEYFAGLEFLHLLSSKKKYEFRAEVIGWNNKLYESSYDDFEVGNETSGYQLSIGNMTEGYVKSSFTDLNGLKFTTKDRDNDEWYQNNCASYYRGGWWLKNCGFDPSREWCNGQGCLSWGEQNGKQIVLKIRPMGAKGSSIVPIATQPPRVKPTRPPRVTRPPKTKPKKPKKPKKKPKNKKAKRPKKPRDNANN